MNELCPPAAPRWSARSPPLEAQHTLRLPSGNVPLTGRTRSTDSVWLPEQPEPIEERDSMDVPRIMVDRLVLRPSRLP